MAPGQLQMVVCGKDGLGCLLGYLGEAVEEEKVEESGPQ